MRRSPLRALENGAVDFVAKPKVDVAEGLRDYADEIIGKGPDGGEIRVRAIEERTFNSAPAIGTKLRCRCGAAATGPAPGIFVPPTISSASGRRPGTEAIKDVLAALPIDIQAGIVISQHIPAAFSGPFARRVDTITPLSGLRGRDGQQIMPGHVYIAPGDRHLLVDRDSTRRLSPQ